LIQQPNSTTIKTISTPTNNPYKIFVIAGESSGDQLGAAILQRLKHQLGHNIIIQGIGGEALIQAGLSSLFPSTDLAVMGLIELIPHIPRLLMRLSQTVAAIKSFQPDLILTIDAPGFNFRVAKKVKKMGIPVIHITAPSVWAWKPKRAKQVAGYLDQLLCLFHFEPPYFNCHGLETHFIGHPLIEKNLSSVDPGPFLDQHQLLPNQRMLVILPGSRKGELDHHLNLFLQVAKKLQQQFPDLILLFPTLPQHQQRIQNSLIQHNLTGIVSSQPTERMMMMRSSTAALAASGTVTLELALCHTPMVVAYKANALTAVIIKRLLITKYISLVNILLNKPAVSELIQQDCTLDRIVNDLIPLLDRQSSQHQMQINQLQSIAPLLQSKEMTPSTAAANYIIKKLHSIRISYDN